MVVKETTDVHRGWMGGGDPAVRGRVGVNGASERSEKGAEQRGGHVQKDWESWEIYTSSLQCRLFELCRKSLDWRVGIHTRTLTAGLRGLLVFQTRWVVLHSVFSSVKCNHDDLTFHAKNTPPKNVLLVRLLPRWTCYVAAVWLKFSNPTNFMQSLEILIQGKMKRFSVFACGLEDWITSLHDQASQPKTHKPQSGLTQFWTPSTPATFIILCTVDLCHAKLWLIDEWDHVFAL